MVEYTGPGKRVSVVTPGGWGDLINVHLYLKSYKPLMAAERVSLVQGTPHPNRWSNPMWSAPDTESRSNVNVTLVYEIIKNIKML